MRGRLRQAAASASPLPFQDLKLYYSELYEDPLMLQARSAAPRRSRSLRGPLQELRCFMLKWLHIFSQSPNPSGSTNGQRAKS